MKASRCGNEDKRVWQRKAGSGGGKKNKKKTRYTHYREIEDEKAETSSRGIEPATLRSTSDLVLHLANDASGFVFPASLRPGKVAER